MKKNKGIIFIILPILLLFSLTGCEASDIKDVVNIIEQIEEIAQDTKVDKENKSTELANKNVENIEGNIRVYFLDVGQGDSIFIKAPNGENILIDGGERKNGDYVVDYLKKLGIEHIDILIATHPHSDHIGGLIKVFENFNIKSVYTPRVTHTTKTYEDFVLAVQEQGLKFKEAKIGVDLDIKGVDATFVGPANTYSDDLNNWSAVLKLDYKDISFLFTGDAEIKSENDIMLNNQDIESTVLKIGHHGSDTSSSDEFLDSVNPSYAIISAGIDNKYGHPNDLVLDKLDSRKIQIYRTDLQGTIIATSDGSDLTFETD